MPGFRPRSRRTCWQSSLVGTRTSALGEPSERPAASRTLSSGSRYAAVLPLPVVAWAITSCGKRMVNQSAKEGPTQADRKADVSKKSHLALERERDGFRLHRRRRQEPPLVRSSDNPRIEPQLIHCADPPPCRRGWGSCGCSDERGSLSRGRGTKQFPGTAFCFIQTRSKTVPLGPVEQARLHSATHARVARLGHGRRRSRAGAVHGLAGKPWSRSSSSPLRQPTLRRRLRRRRRTLAQPYWCS